MGNEALIKLKANKIMVFCPNWVGDVVMATPAFRCLRDNYPDAELVGVIRRYAEGVIEGGPWFDRILCCDDKTLRGFRELVRTIRKWDPDVAVVFPNSMRAVLVPFLAGVNQIYGYRRNWRSVFLSGGPTPIHNEHRPVPIPMKEYYLEICRWLGLEIPEGLRLALYVSDSIEDKKNRLLEAYGIGGEDIVIGMNPGAKFGASKCWPPEYFARLAELFRDNSEVKILLFAGPGEQEIAKLITDKSKAPIINTGPQDVDLALLKALVKRCQLLVTNDTGPRHYAVAFDVPVVVIMGPTDPRYTETDLEKTVVLREELDCSPCHKKMCPRDHECMTMITPSTVFNAAQRVLERFL